MKMKVGDLVGIHWKEGVGFVDSKVPPHIGIILEKDNHHHMYIVYCPAIKRFSPSKRWDSSWLSRLSDED